MKRNRDENCCRLILLCNDFKTFSVSIVVVLAMKHLISLKIGCPLLTNLILH